MSQVINSSSQNTTVSESDSASDVMTQILKQGAQQMLKAAIEAEVQEYLDVRQSLRDEQGHRHVIRNGRLPERELMTGLGPIPVQKSRVRDKRYPTDREEFSSKILPKYLRKAESIKKLIPWLYLKGTSTNDFPEALQALLGPNAKGLSATTITRMKKIWEEGYRKWNKRDLSATRYVYLWADGIRYSCSAL